MKKLIADTTAYAAFSEDMASGRISHAYMLHLQDAKNLREALKIFALAFFGENENSIDGKRILNESFSDMPIFPERGKKFNAEAAMQLLGESALKPLERDKKLFIISGFDEASALVQNKLLKTLEEPCDGVHFLLGAVSLAPVLDTVKSRVKTLTVSPFGERQIFEALERKGKNALNASAAASCGGVFGVAENMVSGGWFSSVAEAAKEICATSDSDKVGGIAVKHGETKYKTELLCEMELIYRKELLSRAEGKNCDNALAHLQTPAIIYALQELNNANEHVKFNAFFQGLLHDLLLRIIKENEKWLKLRQ